ncbi:MAG: nuclear transport factor 2 family protein [Sphingomonadales bacterium]
MSVPESLQILLDKQEIEDLCKRYMRGLDRLDHTLLRSVYHDDATDHRGFFTGGPDEFCEMAVTLLAEHLANHHMLGQMHIDVEGDVAFGEIYFQAFHRALEHGLERDFIVWGRYVDRYERRDGVWKIAHRTELNDACRTDPANDIWLKMTPEALTGARGADDLSSQREKVRTL